MSKKNKKLDDCTCEDEKCHCHGDCDNSKNCDCNDECDCEKNCECEKDCKCEQKKACDESELKQKADEYLGCLQRLQAEFENYRRRTREELELEKIRAKAEVISVFLPCLDTFKEAKKSISDANVLKGVEMIENKILTALSNLKVEKIESIGKVYDPKLHEAIAVMTDGGKENDIILEEYQTGYTFAGRVIREAKVVVNKK